MKSPLGPLLGTFALITALFRPALAADTTPATPAIPEEEIITLPKYEISADRVLPPIERWQYVSIPGFEILSNASARNTKLFVEDFYLLRQVAQIILPSLKESTKVPTYIVLCGEGDAFETFMPRGRRRPGTSRFVGDSERSAIIINFTFQNLSGDTRSVFDSRGNDPFRAFYLQYFRQLVRNSVKPNPPVWLEEGLVQLFAATEFSTKTITIGKVDGESSSHSSGNLNNNGWPSSGLRSGLSDRFHNPVGGNLTGGYNGMPRNNHSGRPSAGGSSAKPGSFNSILARKSLMPLEKFFAYNRKTSLGEYASTYAAQCYLFTHLCLYGRDQRYTKPFFKLVQKASLGPITENLFTECFGMPFKKMEKEMRSYITFTDYKAIQQRATKGHELDTAPKIQLREATDAESSRIAGEALRLAGHKQEAVNRLIAPYIRGQYDADLLAALGLAELSNNKTERARRFLEAAAKANTTRTLAYLELARLRLGETEATAAAENRAPSAAEYAIIQAPLYQGLQHPPALPSLYDLLARTWYLSSAVPSKEQFEQLAEGARQNYADLGLVFRVAALGLKHGHIETSRRFVAFGISNSPDPSTRSKFEQLAKELPPATTSPLGGKTAAVSSSPTAQ